MSTAPDPIPVRPAADANRRPLGHPLVHASFATFAARYGRYGNLDAAEVCRMFFQHDSFGPRFIERSNTGQRFVERATTTAASTSNWGAELAADLVTGFLRSLAPSSAAARLVAAGPVVRLGSHNTLNAPARGTGPATLPWVGEGEPIPVGVFDFNTVAIGPPHKMGFMAVCSTELASRFGALPIFEALLREDAAKSFDAAYFSADAGTANSSAGLLYGVSAASPLGGGSVEAIRQELAALAAAISVNGSGQVLFAVSTDRAAKLAILLPDLAGMIAPSSALSASRIIAIDPLSIVHGVVPEVNITVSDQALMQMDDDPDEIVDASGNVAAPVMSLYQTDRVATRILAEVAFTPRRTGAVAYADISEW